ncbi:Ring finger domain [seawater metagenome]|uniref:Ring finger domain n=1 Tax=seawater metagenome TaxID=1561972 RepID=A0A5E8CJT9_9ZZZZ
MEANQEYQNRFAQLFGIDNRNLLNDPNFILSNSNRQQMNSFVYASDEQNIQSFIFDSNSSGSNRQLNNQSFRYHNPNQDILDMVHRNRNLRNEYFQNSLMSSAIADRIRDTIQEQQNRQNLDDEFHNSLEEYLNENRPTDRNLLKEKISELSCIKTECDTNCTICLENIPKNKQIYKIPCNHKFHKKCLKQWLSENLSCPICREDI